MSRKVEGVRILSPGKARPVREVASAAPRENKGLCEVSGRL